MSSGLMINLAESVRLLGGVLFKKGEAVYIKPIPGQAKTCKVETRGIVRSVAYVRVFKGPGRNLVCAWLSRGYCRSVTGNPCQPGGHDLEGWPCWSLVYGMQQMRGI